jgi:ribosomal protein S18 acetylase RimI-like enzyme
MKSVDPTGPAAHASGMQIVRLDPAEVTDADVAAVHAVRAAATATDAPQDPPRPLEEVALRLRNSRPDRRRLHVLARHGGTLAGYASITLPELDNTHLGQVEVAVHPDSRRRGAGTALLREMARIAAAEGRRTLMGETRADGAGDRFCAALGLTLVQVTRKSLLRLAGVDWADVEALAAAEHSGYRLEPIVDHIPDVLLEGYATAKNAMNDAPFDDVDFTDFVYTADTLRADEVTSRRLGEARAVLAVHEPTGAVAGFTEVLVPRAQPHRAYQEDAAVVPAHRGRGLGLWVKADMLVRLRAERPEVAEIDTSNSATNRHMFAVNDRLGFRPRSAAHNWQGDVADLVSHSG